MLLFCEQTLSLTLDIQISTFQLFKFLRPSSNIWYHMMENQNIRRKHLITVWKYIKSVKRVVQPCVPSRQGYQWV